MQAIERGSQYFNHPPSPPTDDSLILKRGPDNRKQKEKEQRKGERKSCSDKDEKIVMTPFIQVKIMRSTDAQRQEKKKAMNAAEELMKSFKEKLKLFFFLNIFSQIANYWWVNFNKLALITFNAEK